MTENTDKTVLMKCERCGYIEAIPLKDLEFIREPNEEDHVLCPFCLNDMYRLDSKHFNNQ